MTMIRFFFENLFMTASQKDISDRKLHHLLKTNFITKEFNGIFFFWFFFFWHPVIYKVVATSFAMATNDANTSSEFGEISSGGRMKPDLFTLVDGRNSYV